MSDTTALHISHFNIRKSIILLVVRLLVLEVLAIFLIFLMRLPFELFQYDVSWKELYFSVEYRIFFLLLIAKASATIFLLFEWLNEYYELWPDKLIYRSGVLFRKQERYAFKHVSLIGIQQGLIGEICNFGTLYFFEKDMKQYVYFPNIHNPKRYMQILEELNPTAEVKKDIIRHRVLEVKDDYA